MMFPSNKSATQLSRSFQNLKQCQRQMHNDDGVEVWSAVIELDAPLRDLDRPITCYFVSLKCTSTYDRLIPEKILGCDSLTVVFCATKPAYEFVLSEVDWELQDNLAVLSPEDTSWAFDEDETSLEDNLVRVVRDQLGRSRLNPFDSNRPAAPNMVWGRTREISEILETDSPVVLVCGPKQSGKTSILRRLHAALNNSTIKVVELSSHDLNLALEQSTLYERNSREQTLFLVDDWGLPMSQLNGLDSIARACKSKFVITTPNPDSESISPSPKRVDLGPLPRSNAEEWIRGPLGLLGIELHDAPHAINEILEVTGGWPQRIQRFCEMAIEDCHRLHTDKVFVRRLLRWPQNCNLANRNLRPGNAM